MTVTCQNNVCIHGEIKIRLNSGNALQSGVRNLHNISNKLNKWKGVFLENVLFPQLVKTFPHFTKPEGSLPYIQTRNLSLFSDK